RNLSVAPRSSTVPSASMLPSARSGNAHHASQPAQPQPPSVVSCTLQAYLCFATRCTNGFRVLELIAREKGDQLATGKRNESDEKFVSQVGYLRWPRRLFTFCRRFKRRRAIHGKAARQGRGRPGKKRSEEHTSELQSLAYLV